MRTNYPGGRSNLLKSFSRNPYKYFKTANKYAKYANKAIDYYQRPIKIISGLTGADQVVKLGKRAMNYYKPDVKPKVKQYKKTNSKPGSKQVKKDQVFSFETVCPKGPMKPCYEKKVYK